MAVDAVANFAISTVATAPSPATSGTSLTVATGEGALFPTAPFNTPVWPPNVKPLASNCEIVRVSAVVGDVLTIARAQEGTSAISIAVGYQIANTITAKMITDLKSYIDGLTGGLGQLTKFTAGFTAPANSLDRWKAGEGQLATWVDNPVNTTDTIIGIRNAGWAQATLPRIAHYEDESVNVTASSAGRSVADGVLNTTTTITSSTIAFVAGDVGRSVLGTGIPDGAYIASVTNGTTAIMSIAATATASGVSVTLGTLLTISRGENGTAPASHAASTEIYRRRARVIGAIGDSIDEGITILATQTNDPFMDRLHRVMSERYGGMLGKCWGNWRNVDGTGHNEWDSTGFVSSVAGTTSEVGFGGTYAATAITAGSGNSWIWKRPAGEVVKYAEIFIVDVGADSCSGSYSIDGGTTWIAYPLTTKYSSGTGILRKFGFACENPATIRFRAATSGGTSKALVMPSIPLVTFTKYPYNITDGVSMFNAGWGGIKLRQTLNARTSVDAVVTNGSATVTSATATFVAADDESTVYLNGVAYQIDSVTNGTTIVLKTNYAGANATGVRITIFQGDHTGDRLANFIGHAASFRPNLCIIGTCSNDQVATNTALGDANENAYYDFYTYIIKKIKPYSDVLILVPHERNTASITSPVQSAYRAMAHTVATEQAVAIYDIYDAMSAAGYTGYAAANANGWIADGTHLSETGNQFFASRLISALEFS